MKDTLVVGTLVLAFALLLTTQVAIAYGLARRPPRWHALVALLVVPMAPYWAFRERMRVRTGLWLLSLILYVVASIAARY